MRYDGYRHLEVAPGTRACTQAFEFVMTASSAFSAALAFSLGKLGLSHIYLKKEQRSAILAVYQGRDVIVCLPTGYGKSVCYQ